MSDRVIKAYMTLRGISQRDMAKRLNITPANLNHKINGKVQFNINEMKRISEILSVSVEELFFTEMISRLKIEKVV